MKNSYTALKYILFSLWALLIFVTGFFVFHPLRPVCANSISCARDVSGSYQRDLTYATFMGNTYPVPSDQTSLLTSNVLGDTTSANKRIEVDLTNQKLYAFDGDKLIYNFSISSGKWNKTPTGTFHLWIKLRYTKMEGGTKGTGDYYNLPNVPYTMFFYNEQYPKYLGYGIHGAYWHNNFGHPMSHGCINLKIADSETLYNWASPSTKGNTTFATDDDPGTPVIIYGVTPAS